MQYVFGIQKSYMLRLNVGVVMVLNSKDSSELIFEKLHAHGFSNKVVYEIWYWYHFDTANVKR
jgi:hypothetical protein